MGQRIGVIQAGKANVVKENPHIEQLADSVCCCRTRRNLNPWSEPGWTSEDEYLNARWTVFGFSKKVSKVT